MQVYTINVIYLCIKLTTGKCSICDKLAVFPVPGCPEIYIDEDSSHSSCRTKKFFKKLISSSRLVSGLEESDGGLLKLNSLITLGN